MPTENDNNLLVCLFHHREQAEAALEDLRDAGVPRTAISTVDGTSSSSTNTSVLASFGVPDRDQKHLVDGLNHGGFIIAVAAEATQVHLVERIFGAHRAAKTDEAQQRVEPVAAQDQGVVPIVEEELKVGKRTVDRGGVRVYRRVIEIPVEQSVSLRDERVVVERKVVDRPAGEADLAAKDRSIELTETAEEAVLTKTAHVVEEVVIGKEVGEHVEHIHETVRRTEVEVEELPASNKSQRQ